MRLPIAAFVVYARFYFSIDVGFEYGVIAGGLLDSGENLRFAKYATLACNFDIILSFYVLWQSILVFTLTLLVGDDESILGIGLILFLRIGVGGICNLGTFLYFEVVDNGSLDSSYNSLYFNSSISFFSSSFSASMRRSRILPIFAVTFSIMMWSCATAVSCGFPPSSC